MYYGLVSCEPCVVASRQFKTTKLVRIHECTLLKALAVAGRLLQSNGADWPY